MTTAVLQAWQFAKYDDVSSLKSLVPSAVSPDACTFSRESYVHTLLMSAAIHGSVACAEHLLDSGALVDKKNFMGYTALHWTAFSGRVEAVELLLSRGADIEARTDDGKTAVHIAAWRGHLQYLRHIAELGADLSASTATGQSAVHFAVVGNFQLLCQFLVAQGVDAATMDMKKVTPMDLAERHRRAWAAGVLASQQQDELRGTEEEEEVRDEPVELNGVSEREEAVAQKNSGEVSQSETQEGTAGSQVTAMDESSPGSDGSNHG